MTFKGIKNILCLCQNIKTVHALCWSKDGNVIYFVCTGPIHLIGIVRKRKVLIKTMPVYKNCYITKLQVDTERNDRFKPTLYLN